MELKLLGMHILIHLRAERKKSDLKKLVTEFRREYHEVKKMLGESLTAEEFAKAVAAEREERIHNMATKKV